MQSSEERFPLLLFSPQRHGQPEADRDKRTNCSQSVAMKFECHHCGQQIEATSDWAGLSAECPSCGGNITVPSQEEEWPAPPPDRSPAEQSEQPAPGKPPSLAPSIDYDIFLSYRRGKGAEIAQLLKERLEHLGFRAFLDVECLREGDWLLALKRQISSCTDFIPIITDGFFDHCTQPDDVVRLEIEIAIAKEKNIIPLLVAESPFPASLPPSLSRISSFQGVPYSTAFANESLTKLLGMIRSNRFGLDRLATNEVMPKVVVIAVAILLALLHGGHAGYGGLANLLTIPVFALISAVPVFGALFGASLLFKINPGQLLCAKDWLIFWIIFIPIVTLLAGAASLASGFSLSFVFGDHTGLISFASMAFSLAVVLSFTRQVLSRQLWRFKLIPGKETSWEISRP